MFWQGAISHFFESPQISNLETTLNYDVSINLLIIHVIIFIRLCCLDMVPIVNMSLEEYRDCDAIRVVFSQPVCHRRHSRELLGVKIFLSESLAVV